MKIKKEEIEEEVIETRETKKVNGIKEEEEDVLEPQLRASIANPSSPPSGRCSPPKRPPSPDPNPTTSASLTVTVAVARRTSVRQNESNNDHSVDPSPAPVVQALRRSTRKRKGEDHPSLDTGDSEDGSDIRRPSKKMKMRKKKIRRGNPRAPGVTVDLSHLGTLPEHLAEDLDVLFCGINAGRTSATVGHHYANGTNHFWPCLHLSGFTPRQLAAAEDSTLPEVYNLGLTNLVQRASISEAQLLNREMADSVPALLAKIARWRPRVMCFNGKGIWLHVERSLQQQLIQSNGSDNSATGGSRVLVPKREDEEELKPITPDMRQERPVKTERVTARRLQRPSLKKDTSNDGVATNSPVAVPKREEEESKPNIADMDNERSLRTKRVTSASGSGRSTANSSNLDAGRLLRSSTSVTVPAERRGPVSSVTPKKATTATQSTFVYGIQPYKAVHDAKNATVHETLFCVFPSSSGRVVSHQRNDKVVLFKKLREDLELIKAGTFDTSSMQLVRLDRQGA